MKSPTIWRSRPWNEPCRSAKVEYSLHYLTFQSEYHMSKTVNDILDKLQNLRDELKLGVYTASALGTIHYLPTGVGADKSILCLAARDHVPLAKAIASLCTVLLQAGDAAEMRAAFFDVEANANMGELLAELDDVADSVDHQMSRLVRLAQDITSQVSHSP